MKTYVRHALESVEKDSHDRPSKDSSKVPAFHEALKSKHMLPDNRSERQQFANGNTVFIAGSETTAASLTAGTFHVLSNASVMQRLQSELDKAWSNGTPSWADLENVPYLRAVVMETLRLNIGVSRRFPRVNHFADTILNAKTVIPRGCIMSTSHRYLHLNPEIFPEPHQFDPDRWMASAEETQRLARYVVPFSKGIRNCLASRYVNQSLLGKRNERNRPFSLIPPFPYEPFELIMEHLANNSIAQAEIYLALAHVHHQFDLELFETTRENVEAVFDWILPFPKGGKMTVKVKVKERKGVPTEGET